MRKLAILLAVPMALFSTVALAQNAQPEVEILGLEAPEGDVDAGSTRPWVDIGADPFRGDVAKGAKVLSAKTDYNPSDFLEGARMRSLGQCIRYTLKDGDVLRTTFDLDRSMLARVAFAPGKPRGADVCIVQRHGESARAVVFPDGCTNLSAARVVLRLRVAFNPPAPPSAPPVRMRSSMSAANEPSFGGGMMGVGVVYHPSYHSGKFNVNAGSRSAASSSSISTSGSGNCSTCGGGHAPVKPGHISGE